MEMADTLYSIFCLTLWCFERLSIYSLTNKLNKCLAEEIHLNYHDFIEEFDGIYVIKQFFEHF